jgi:hypothetical protein
MKKAVSVTIILLIFGLGCRKNDSTPQQFNDTLMHGEDQRTCASAEMLADEIKNDPARSDYLETLEKKIQDYSELPAGTKRQS